MNAVMQILVQWLGYVPIKNRKMIKFGEQFFTAINQLISTIVDFKEDEVWALCISNPFNIGQNFSQKIEGKEE